MKRKLTKIIIILFFLFSAIWICFYILSVPINNRLISLYNDRQSLIVRDKNQEIIKIYPNKLGLFSLRADNYPQRIIDLITKKEDRFFFFHPGINPVSTGRAIVSFLFGDKNPSSSTITQQTSKILLGNEQDRTFKNKLKESFYALAMEAHSTKKEIINIYLNSIFFGNQVEGIQTASRLYFGKTPQELNDAEIIQLLAIISNPSNNHPYTKRNIEASLHLAKNLGVRIDKNKLQILDEKKTKKDFSNFSKKETSFEIDDLKIKFNNSKEQILTIDNNLSEKTRKIIQSHLNELFQNNAHSSAVVIIDTRNNQNKLLTLIGSPNPSKNILGYKINMTTRPRTIGSTIKPFIYTKSFEMKLRPYTEVVDREYKYHIGTGFALYPKNYDYKYRGLVNLHYALSNSLNVPTVKVLEYIKLDNFYSLLEDSLEFHPIQSMDNYQLGIALGGLEMDLLTLSYYFTIFPHEGNLRPLLIQEDTSLKQINNNNFNLNKKIFDSKYIALTNKILNDRKMGIEQFGITSNLNLVQDNYAVKTGTSREYHDSWCMGYTPDFVVGVWVGNTEDTPMDHISGQTGAGLIWQDVMNLLFNSDYNKKTPFNFEGVKDFSQNETLEYGLVDDDYNKQKYLLKDKKLILKPHSGDNFLFEDNMSIFLKASAKVDWYINGKFFGNKKEMFFKPYKAGNYTIKAIDNKNNINEEINVVVNTL